MFNIMFNDINCIDAPIGEVFLYENLLLKAVKGTGCKNCDLCDSPVAHIEINEVFHSFKHLSPCDEQYGKPALFIIPKGAYYMVNHNEGKYITYVSNQIIFKKIISVQEHAYIVYHEFLNRYNKDNKNK